MPYYVVKAIGTYTEEFEMHASDEQTARQVVEDGQAGSPRTRERVGTAVQSVRIRRQVSDR